MDDLDALVAEHGPMVWRCICRVLGNDHGAGDCFQDTFLQFIQLSRRQRVRSPLGMLKRIAVRRAIDELRARIDRRQFFETIRGDLPSAGFSQPQMLIAGELQQRLRAALLKINATEATIFCLTQFQDMSHDEAAKVLGIKVNHVAVLLHRARAALQKELGGGSIGEVSHE